MNKLKKLREEMKENNIDCYIVPTSDPHNSEYIPEKWKYREWLTGFTGSAGTFVITLEKSGLWTDGRYFIQAEEELKNTEIKLYRLGIEEEPYITEWILNNTKENSRIGVYGKLFTLSQLRNIRMVLTNRKLETTLDIVKKIRGKIEEDIKKAYFHIDKFSGEDISTKIKRVKEKLFKNNIDYYIISSLENVSWIYNIKGKDIEYNPFVLSYAIIGEQNYLFIDKEKLTEELINQFKINKVKIYDYEEIYSILETLEKKNIGYDPNKINSLLKEKINFNSKKIEFRDIIEELKAIKNPIQIENYRNCQKRDNSAMVKFLYWLDKNIETETLTELSIENKLKEFREKEKYFIGESFRTIAGFNENGAIVHYAATEESNKKIDKKGFLLLDSGGQYLDGTTDITRTIFFREPSKELKEKYTLVLKGHINLSLAKFKSGTKGYELDNLARKYLNEKGLDYNHGTGHGVGYLGGVHEGPQNISKGKNQITLKKGMLVTNEPGYYKQNEYGIRIENILLVAEDENNLYFENMTYCPIETIAIDKDMLTEVERDWLNNYHNNVYNTLKDTLNEEERNWLKEKTKKV